MTSKVQAVPFNTWYAWRIVYKDFSDNKFYSVEVYDTSARGAKNQVIRSFYGGVRVISYQRKERVA